MTNLSLAPIINKLTQLFEDLFSIYSPVYSNKCLLLVSYNYIDTLRSLQFLNLLNCSKRILIVNNHSIFKEIQMHDLALDWILILGSNKSAEFSAWQEGLDYLIDKEDFARFVFCNDTVCTHRKFSIVRYFCFSLSCLQNPNSATGFTNCSRIPLELYGLTFSSWISTYFFSIPRDGLNRLKFRINDSQNLEGYISSSYSGTYFFKNSLNDNLNKHITAWLFNGGWYKSAELSNSNFEGMKLKAICILNEKSLSVRMRLSNIIYIDPFKRSSYFIQLLEKLCKITNLYY